MGFKMMKVDAVIHGRMKVHCAIRQVTMQDWLELVILDAMERERLPELAIHNDGGHIKPTGNTVKAD